MADPLTIIGGAIATLKKLRDVSQKLKDAETSNLIADVNMALADLRMQVAELQQEKVALQAELREAKAQDDVREKLEVRNGMYYFKEPVPGKSDGPYCSRCFEVDSKLVSLTILMGGGSRLGKYYCPNCKSPFK